MINPVKVLVAGSTPEDRMNHYLPDERIIWVFYVPDETRTTTDAENHLQLRKMLHTTDIVVLDVRFGDPSFDEGVILQTAYSNQTPIFLIGDCLSSELIHHLESNAFLDPGQAMDHIVENYT